MESRQGMINSIWETLQETPRMKVNALLAEMGLAKSMYAKLPDEGARKVFLGIVTRLDDAALEEVIPALQAS